MAEWPIAADCKSAGRKTYVGSNPTPCTMKNNKLIINLARKTLKKELLKCPEVIIHTDLVEKGVRILTHRAISDHLALAIIFHDISNRPGVKDHQRSSFIFAKKWLRESQIDTTLSNKVMGILDGEGPESKILKSADAIANITSPINIPLLLFRSWHKLAIKSFKGGIIEARKKLLAKSNNVPKSQRAKFFSRKLKADLEFLDKCLQFLEKP